MPRADPHHRQRDHPAQGASGRCPLRPDRLAGTEDPAAQGPQPRLIDLGTQRKCLGAPSRAAKILLTWGFAVQAQMTTLQLPRSDLPAGQLASWDMSAVQLASWDMSAVQEKCDEHLVRAHRRAGGGG